MNLEISKSDKIRARIHSSARKPSAASTTVINLATLYRVLAITFLSAHCLKAAEIADQFAGALRVKLPGYVAGEPSWPTSVAPRDVPVSCRSLLLVTLPVKEAGKPIPAKTNSGAVLVVTGA